MYIGTTVDCGNCIMLVYEFYIVSMSILVYVHIYDFKCRMMTGNTKQSKDDSKEKENY